MEDLTETKVSVIIPAYNASKTIAPCVRAVLASDHPNLEVFVVNDGSRNTNYEELLAPFKIRILHQENKGAGAARNLGAKQASGAYLYFLDSDVIVSPDTISKLLALANEHKAELATGTYSLEPMNKKVTHHYKAVFDHYLTVPEGMAKCVIKNHCFGGTGDFYEKRAFVSLGGFSENFKGASVEREELWLRFFDSGFTAAADPRITVGHYFPDFFSLVKNYLSRIYLSLEIVKRGNTKSLYPSIRKSILTPMFAFFVTLSLFLAVIQIIGFEISLFFLLIYLVLNFPFIKLSLKQKGLIWAIKFVPINFFFNNLVFVAGVISVLIIKTRALVETNVASD